MPDESPRPLPRARKRFGQHFLVDARALDRIVAALAPDATSTVVEIGPGRGALTRRLVARAARVIAIELDRDLAAHLAGQYRGDARVRIVPGDALQVSWPQLAGGSYLLAGNLPYYITTPLLFRALESPRPERAVLLVQREVGERVTAQPGSKTYGALSVNVQVVAEADLAGTVAPGAFRPRPAVDSVILRLVPRVQPLIEQSEEPAFRAFVQSVFGLRRKQMLRVVRQLWELPAEVATTLLANAAIAPTARPETLAPGDFVRVFRLAPSTSV